MLMFCVAYFVLFNLMLMFCGVMEVVLYGLQVALCVVVFAFVVKHIRSLLDRSLGRFATLKANIFKLSDNHNDHVYAQCVTD